MLCVVLVPKDNEQSLVKVNLRIIQFVTLIISSYQYPAETLLSLQPIARALALTVSPALDFLLPNICATNKPRRPLSPALMGRPFSFVSFGFSGMYILQFVTLHFTTFVISYPLTMLPRPLLRSLLGLDWTVRASTPSPSTTRRSARNLLTRQPDTFMIHESKSLLQAAASAIWSPLKTSLSRI
jgi:hypothetical protein